jgi:DNA-binding protein HU-alpha
MLPQDKRDWIYLVFRTKVLPIKNNTPRGKVMGTTTKKTTKAKSGAKTAPRKTTTKTATKKTSAPRNAPVKKAAKPISATAAAKPPAPKPIAPTVVNKPQPVVLGPVMRKKELIETVVTRTGIKKKDAKPVVESMLAVLGEALAEGRELILPPLGKVIVRKEKKLPKGKMMIVKVRQVTPPTTAVSVAKEADE